MADAGDASSPARAGLVAAGTSESVRPFVGRLRELEELSAVLVGSSAGRGGLFMVTGEPGIGKSRLMAVPHVQAAGCVGAGDER